MSDLGNIGGVVRKLLPWAKGFSLSPRALVITSATKIIEIMGKTIELAGGGAGVARVGDVAGYLYVVIVMGAVVGVFWSAKSGAGSTWHAVASGALPPVDGVTTGTAVVISTGSTKVSAG